MTEQSVDEYIASLDDETAADARAMLELMQGITGETPQLWNVGTLGFGMYHYKYDSGREGDGHTIGFYPRKGKTTLYLMDGTARHADLLARLGAHTLTGYCIYFKRLNDLNLPVLEQLIRDSYDYVTAKSADGPIREILWKADD